MNHKRPKLALLALVAVLFSMLLPGCSSTGVAEIEYMTIKGQGYSINVGAANINWWLLSGGVNHISINSTELDKNGQPKKLKKASLKVFSDDNKDGVWNQGEAVMQFDSDENTASLSIDNINISAGSLPSGFNSDNAHYQFEVERADGSVGIHTGSL